MTPGPHLEQLLPAFARAFPVQLVGATAEYGEPQLFADLGGDAKGRPRRLEMTLLPRDEDDPYFLQFFVLMPFSFEPARAGDLARTIALVNVKLPLGHFGMNEPTGWVYFRTVSLPPPVPLDGEQALQTAQVCAFLVDQIAHVLESVAEGSSTVEAAMQAYDALASGQDAAT